MERGVSIIDRLNGIFTPLYAKWQEWSPTDLYLWQETSGMSDRLILENDIRTIGTFFAHADGIGARTEYVLIAECIAILRLMHQNLPLSRNLLEPEIDIVCKQLQHKQNSHKAKIEFHEESTPQKTDPPLAWRIAKHLLAAGRCSPNPVHELHNAFLDLGHLLILRDGNITQEEDRVWETYGKSFNL